MTAVQGAKSPGRLGQDEASLMWVFYQEVSTLALNDTGNPLWTFHHAELLYREPERLNVIHLGVIFEGTEEGPIPHLGSRGAPLCQLCWPAKQHRKPDRGCQCMHRRPQLAVAARCSPVGAPTAMCPEIVEFAIQHM